jgi:hypothetical protein
VLRPPEPTPGDAPDLVVRCPGVTHADALVSAAPAVLPRVLLAVGTVSGPLPVRTDRVLVKAAELADLRRALPYRPVPGTVTLPRLVLPPEIPAEWASLRSGASTRSGRPIG